jgi:iron complex outermembrane recepter protein
VEFVLPVLKNLELQLAARTDRYSDYGRSTIPKIGAAWTVNPSVKLRASYSEGFRAPSLTEISKSSTSAFTTVVDPKLCLTGFENQCDQNIGVLIEANPNVRPETAKTYNVGTVFEITKDTSISIDYFKIDRKKEITNLSISEILRNEDNPDPRYRGRVVRGAVAPGQPVGDIQVIRTGFFNLGRTVVDGIDLDVRTRFSLGEYGRLTAVGLVTYTDTFKGNGDESSPFVSSNDFRDFPRVRARINGNWEKGNWTSTISVNYMSGFRTFSNGDTTGATCASNAAGSIYLGYCRVTEQVTMDLGTEYRGFKNMVLSLIVQNATNQRPSADPLNRPVNLDWFQPYGAYFTLGARYTFK